MLIAIFVIVILILIIQIYYLFILNNAMNYLNDNVSKHTKKMNELVLFSDTLFKKWNRISPSSQYDGMDITLPMEKL